MKAVLTDIQDGTFAKRFIERPGRRRAGVQGAAASEEEKQPIEAVGHELRDLMSWVKSHDDDYVEGSAAR